MICIQCKTREAKPTFVYCQPCCNDAAVIRAQADARKRAKGGVTAVYKIVDGVPILKRIN